MLIRLGAGEEPPFVLPAEDRRISVRSHKEVLYRSPSCWKWRGTVESHRVCAQGFRDHVVIALPEKDIRIRKMKWFAQYNLAVLPGQAIATGGQSDFSQIVLVVQHLEKHVPASIHFQHEGIGN